jgi:5-methylcytosine-specific restriction endonuclease McrA
LNGVGGMKISGGADKIENLVLACPACNLRKYTKTGEEFRKSLGVDDG